MAAKKRKKKKSPARKRSTATRRRKPARRAPVRRAPARRRTKRRKTTAAGACRAGFVQTQINPKTGKRFKRVLCLKWSGPRAKVRTHVPRKVEAISPSRTIVVRGIAGRRRRRR